MSTFTLEDLETIIAERALQSEDTSYTASLLAGGTTKCAKKFGEEAVETILAAMSEDRQHLCSETADTLYHLLVLLRSRGVQLSDVMAELEARTAQSGHQEKASRSTRSND